MLAPSEVALHEDVLLVEERGDDSVAQAQQAAGGGVCDVLRAAALQAVGCSEDARPAGAVFEGASGSI